MKGHDEFKGYRTKIAYDAKSGKFFSEKLTIAGHLKPAGQKRPSKCNRKKRKNEPKSLNMEVTCGESRSLSDANLVSLKS
jgi:hypothetical protein